MGRPVQYNTNVKLAEMPEGYSGEGFILIAAPSAQAFITHRVLQPQYAFQYRLGAWRAA